MKQAVALLLVAACLALRGGFSLETAVAASVHYK